MIFFFIFNFFISKDICINLFWESIKQWTSSGLNRLLIALYIKKPSKLPRLWTKITCLLQYKIINSKKLCHNSVIAFSTSINNWLWSIINSFKLFSVLIEMLHGISLPLNSFYIHHTKNIFILRIYYFI